MSPLTYLAMVSESVKMSEQLEFFSASRPCISPHVAIQAREVELRAIAENETLPSVYSKYWTLLKPLHEGAPYFPDHLMIEVKEHWPRSLRKLDQSLREWGLNGSLWGPTERGDEQNEIHEKKGLFKMGKGKGGGFGFLRMRTELSTGDSNA